MLYQQDEVPFVKSFKPLQLETIDLPYTFNTYLTRNGLYHVFIRYHYRISTPAGIVTGTPKFVLQNTLIHTITSSKELIPIAARTGLMAFGCDRDANYELKVHAIISWHDTKIWGSIGKRGKFTEEISIMAGDNDGEILGFTSYDIIVERIGPST